MKHELHLILCPIMLVFNLSNLNTQKCMDLARKMIKKVHKTFITRKVVMAMIIKASRNQELNSNAMCSFSNAMCSFSNAMCSFSNAMCSFSNAMCSFSNAMCSFSNVMGSLVKSSFSHNVFKLDDFVFFF